MKTPLSFPKFAAVMLLGLAGALALPQGAEAKPKHHKARSSDHHHRDYDRHQDRDWYYSRPRSSFVLSFGTGYAGRGYYYGPAGVPYYYNAPGVRYYATRSVVPSEYMGYSTGYGNADAAVQSALARRGYYYGPIDGDIGPMSSRAIARYQADHGLAVTGSITSRLLRSLGL